MSDSAETPIQPTRQKPRGSGGFLLGFLLIIGLAAATYFFGGNLFVDVAAEREARKQLESLGALTLLDANQKHVAMINLVTVTDPAKFRQAISMIEKFPRAKVMELTGTPTTDADLRAIGKLSRLTSLNLNKTGVGDVGVAHLKSLGKLSALYLAETKVTDASLAKIGKMRSLTVLDLSSTKLSSDFAELANLRNLEWILCDDHHIGMDRANHLMELPKISRITNSTGTIDDDAKTAIKSKIPRMSFE
ncbi:MAG: hypothetical protein AAF497_04465 [Planctomycetota bacterium]